MAITGIVGLKSLIYERAKWVSPARRSYEWPGPLAWSECSFCPKDDEGHIIIRQSCTCGLYATLWDDEFRDYMMEDAIGFLVEAIGHIIQPHAAHTWAHTHGFTSSGLLIVAAVNLTRTKSTHGRWVQDGGNVIRDLNKHYYLLKKAEHDFNIPIINYDEARIIMQTMWTTHNLPWPTDIPRI